MKAFLMLEYAGFQQDSYPARKAIPIAFDADVEFMRSRIAR
jgi:hypothetical protein